MVSYRRTFVTLFLVCLVAVSYAAPVPRPRPRATNAKRGVAFSSTVTADLSKVANTQISWEYNWGVAAPADLPSGIEHVPMQWGKDNIEGFQDAVKQAGAKYILGFNEPERGDQADLRVEEAVPLWKQYINPLGDSVALGAPSVSSAPEGKKWLQDFMAACGTDCKIDFIPIHWYGAGAEGFISYVQDIHTTFPDKKLWVTEFGDTTLNDPKTVQAFLTDTIEQLDGLDFVERYSWFDYARVPAPELQTNLLDVNGDLNDLGKAYV